MEEAPAAYITLFIKEASSAAFILWIKEEAPAYIIIFIKEASSAAFILWTKYCRQLLLLSPL
jgi:hypothetical protein